jgi:hypothetical protein
MTRNPLLNALVAALYIIAVALVLFLTLDNMESLVPEVLIPILVISLFVLSTAVMAYIFLYEPVKLYFEGKNKEGLSLFLKTTGVFGGLVLIFLLVLVLIVSF